MKLQFSEEWCQKVSHLIYSGTGPTQSKPESCPMCFRCSVVSMKVWRTSSRRTSTICSVMTLTRVRNVVCRPGLIACFGDVNQSPLLLLLVGGHLDAAHMLVGLHSFVIQGYSSLSDNCRTKCLGTYINCFQLYFIKVKYGVNFLWDIVFIVQNSFQITLSFWPLPGLSLSEPHHGSALGLTPNSSWSP